MKTREELNNELNELDQFCKNIDPEKLFKEDHPDSRILEIIKHDKKYSHREIKEILLVFKHNFESEADHRSSDSIIDTIHDPVCGCLCVYEQRELKRRLLTLKRCLEVICDYYCSDSILDEYIRS